MIQCPCKNNKMAKTPTIASQQQLKKRRKRKASTNALREIRREQKRTHNIIPVAPFNRLVQELSENYKSGLRFKSQAYAAFHTAAEDYLIKVFTDANKIAIHSRRETVQPKDIKLAVDREA